MAASPTILRIGRHRSRPRTWRSTSASQTWVANMATARIFRGECERFARYDSWFSRLRHMRKRATRVAHVIGASSAALILAAGVSRSQQGPDAPTPYVGPRVPPTSAAIEQTEPGSAPGVALVESFDGLGLGFNGPQGIARAGHPSDNSLAVGPIQIV